MPSSSPSLSPSRQPLPTTSALADPSSSKKRPIASPADHAPSAKRVAFAHPIGSSGGVPAAPFGSGKSLASASGASAAGCRLLWRGKVVNEHNRGLHGIAIVAHLFAVPFMSPQQIAAQPSPFDDPFSPSSASSGADMCLGLEMMRGGDLKLLGEVEVIRPGQALREGPSTRGKERERVEVETPTDVRVYVDARCSETIEWFERVFCMEGRENIGIKLVAGGEEVIIFASHPATSITAASALKPTLTLLLGRAARIRIRRPRPDDPMPRESLFANKLRRTSSLPVLAFGAKAKPIARATTFGSLKERSKPKPKAPGSKMLLGLLEGEKDKDRLSAIAKGKGKATAKAKEGASLAGSRLKKLVQPQPRASTSARDPFTTTSNAARPVVPSKRRLPPQRGRATLPLSSDDDDDDSGGGVPGSPTPSVATTINDGLDDDETEEADVVGELRSFAGSRGSAVPLRTAISDASGATQLRKGMTRSNSAPVGLFALRGGERSMSMGPETRETSLGPLEGIEAKNKATIRKIVLARLTSRGLQREHEEFRDVFSMTIKGVQFALRTTLKIFPIDRSLATELADKHATMYVMELAPVKQEEVEPGDEGKRLLAGRGESHLPSPDSQEVGLEPDREQEEKVVQGTRD